VLKLKGLLLIGLYYVTVIIMSVDLVKVYKKYVEWCERIGTYPIGFVPWKEIRWNMKFNERDGSWTKNK
jgi:hypothetical protein